jgi:hypothetical protein
MFPAGISTMEGINRNRIYYAYTNSSTHADVKQLRIRYSDDAAAGGNTWQPAWNDPIQPHGYGPIGNGLVSQAGYTTKPVLDIDKTKADYVWLTYMEDAYTLNNPYGVPNLYIAVSNDGFHTWRTYRLTADGFSKTQKVTSVIDNTIYTVYASSSSAANMDIWLRILALPDVTIISPATGDRWLENSIQQIKWYITNGTPPYNMTIKYSLDGGITYTTIVTLSNQSKGTGTYNWTVPAAASRDCYIKIDVVDAEGFVSGVRSNVFTIGGISQIALQTGWNFISIPTILPNESIEYVLQSIATKYDIVEYYDASSVPPDWKIYEVGKPDYLIDLHTINNQMGFWIHMVESAVYNITGNWSSTDTHIQLYAGWNMVGYPSMVGMKVKDAFSNAPAGYIVQCYNSSQPYMLRTMNADELLEPGNAYWVYMPEQWLWIVPP